MAGFEYGPSGDGNGIKTDGLKPFKVAANCIVRSIVIVYLYIVVTFHEYFFG